MTIEALRCGSCMATRRPVAVAEKDSRIIDWIESAPNRMWTIDEPSDPVSSDVQELVTELIATDAAVAWIVSALDRWKRITFLLDVLGQLPER